MHHKNIKQAANFALEDIHVASKLVRGKLISPYIGLVGHNNLGDEVLYRAHQELFPNLSLTPYRKNTVYLEKFGRIINKPFSDYAILGGGTLINDGDDWLGRVEYLQSQGTMLFSLGTGAESSAFHGGSDANNKLLKRWVKALDKFGFIGVRGYQSKAILEAAGASRVVVTGDTALSLTPAKVKKSVSRGIVGINYGDVPGNPMWGDRAKYRSEIVRVIKFLIASGSKVVLLPIWKMDIASNESIVSEVGHPDCCIQKAYDSFERYSEAVQQCDAFVGQKLHATIFAVMNRVPAIMIEYRPKCFDFMSSVKLEDFVIKTSEFTLEQFLTMYNKLQKHASRIESRTTALMLEYKSKQFAQALKISEQIAF